jgi:hypothetical protein
MRTPATNSASQLSLHSFVGLTFWCPLCLAYYPKSSSSLSECLLFTITFGYHACHNHEAYIWWILVSLYWLLFKLQNLTNPNNLCFFLLLWTLNVAVFHCLRVKAAEHFCVMLDYALCVVPLFHFFLAIMILHVLFCYSNVLQLVETPPFGFLQSRSFQWTLLYLV